MRTRRAALKLLGVGAIASPSLMSASYAQAMDNVQLGIPGSVSDGAFYASIYKDYFKQQNLNIICTSFQNGSQMVAPLGAGQVDAASGATSAGLYNAIARGIDIKIVADKSSNMPGYCYMPLLVRKDYVESGRFKTFSDLKGFRVAEAGKGGAPGSTLNEALKAGGLRYDDVSHVYNMPYPDMAVALQNRAVDAAIVIEPSATRALMLGVAVRYPSDMFYPSQNVSPLLYSGKFIKERPDVARRFMIAYLQGVRFYNGACKNGRLAGPNADELIEMLIKETNVKDPAIYRAVSPNGVDPDGRLNLESLNKDLAFYKELKLVPDSIAVADAVDTSFVEAALTVLGPHVAGR
ncbi:MAG: transporter substrate-binding protein [Bradyrhizobium sp.]|jgi:NitT/TauT family transport system substrate-binding protein|nr:transporter substrate-binding protein [Bradyrhizobium sp.]